MSEIVRIRIMGPRAAVDQLVADLQEARLDIRDLSAPYANRPPDAGVRRYLTVVVPQEVAPGTT